MTALAMAGLYAYRRHLQRSFHDIDVDDDGLWPADQDKVAALIRWDSIERWSQQRAGSPVVLFNHAGQELISLSP